MVYIKFTLFFVLSFSLNIFIWLTCWFWGLVAATFKLENLPGPLYYLQTHDDWVYGHGWKRKLGVPPKWFQRVKLATWWLARNPGYAFDALVLGVRATEVMWRTEVRYDLLYQDKLVGFGYKRDVPITSKTYIKIWLGWHFEPKGGTDKRMLKIAFGPKFN